MISTDTPANVIHDLVPSQQGVRANACAARGVALGALAVYLAMSAIVLCAGRHFSLALGHAAALELVRRCWKPSNETMRVVGDLLPLVVFPLLYSELPQLIGTVGTTYHDVAVQAWETALFGGQPSRTLAARFPVFALSELLHAGYLAYYLMIFIPPALLYLRGERAAYGATVAALAMTYGLCWTAFIVFPVEGPRYLYLSPSAAPMGPVREFALWVLARGSSRGAAFPSSHMAISVVQTMMALRWQPRVAAVLVPVTLLIGIGAVYGGFHYAIDIVAGAVLGLLVAILSMRV